MRAGRTLPCLALLFCAGCGRYADFTLPPLGPPSASLAYRLELRPDPVITRGAPGGWDSTDVLNPSLVLRGGTYYNFYSGFDSHTWHTGLAVSSDGIHWQKRARILSPDPRSWEGDYIAANGSALFFNGEFLYWYQAGPRNRPSLGFARSPDGLTWRKHDGPVLEPGPRGSWDEFGVADPDVIRAGDFFYLFYLGQDRARRQRLGLARSRNGVRWAKLRANPVLELGGPGAFDEAGLGEPAVWTAGGFYWMLYTGRDAHEQRRLGLARSTDGSIWQKLSIPLTGGRDWNRRVICDPAIERFGNGLAVWFGGGDIAAPDENIHGQIGLAIFHPQ